MSCCHMLAGLGVWELMQNYLQIWCVGAKFNGGQGGDLNTEEKGAQKHFVLIFLDNMELYV